MPPRRGGIVGCPAVAGGAQLLGEPAGAFGGVQEARDLLVGEFGGELVGVVSGSTTRSARPRCG